MARKARKAQLALKAAAAAEGDTEPSFETVDLTKVNGAAVQPMTVALPAPIPATATATPFNKAQVAVLMSNAKSSLKELASNKYSANSSITQLQPCFAVRDRR